MNGYSHHGVVSSLAPLLRGETSKARSGRVGVRGCFHIGTRGESPSPGSHLRCDPTSPRKRGEASTSTRRLLVRQPVDALGPGEAGDREFTEVGPAAVGNTGEAFRGH